MAVSLLNRSIAGPPEQRTLFHETFPPFTDPQGERYYQLFEVFPQLEVFYPSRLERLFVRHQI